MKYRMIAIDMDGTLLNSNMMVSDRNRKALKVATEKGVQVVLSTGRIFTSARYYAKLLGLITPIISCNGAYVCEYHRDNVLYEDALDFLDFKDVVEIIEENNLYYHFYDNHNFYTKEINHSSLRYYNWNDKQKPGDRINIEIIDNPAKIAKEKNMKIYKIVIVDDDKEKIDNVKKQLSKHKNIEVVSSWNNNLEIMNKGVSKGKALERLCRLMNIKRDEVIAIGDNYNDIPMLDFAGTSVAMGNGEQEAKEKSDFITDTNDNDGVAKAIEKLIF